MADSDLKSLNVFDILKTLSDGKNFRLHLWGIAPFHFEGRKRKNRYWRLLNGEGKIKSLYIQQADEYLKIAPSNITIEDIFIFVRNDLNARFPTIIQEIMKFDNHTTYFYDTKSNKYIDAKLSNQLNSEQNSSSVITLSTSETQTPYSMEKELIELPNIRMNGKEVCQQLRAFRKDFAAANSIPFQSEDCDYMGPCAGTCEKCEEELTYLYGQLQNLNKQAVYPYLEIPDYREKICIEDINAAMAVMPGYLLSKKQVEERRKQQETSSKS